MAVSDPQMLRAIHQISEALGSSERTKVFYLCETLDTDNTAAHMKETLKSKVMMSYDTGRLFLAELLLHLRRVLMAHISEDMATEDVNGVKFLLGNTLPHEKMETATNFLDLIIELEHLDKVSPERVDFLEECLMNVGRIDLAKKLKMYKMSVNLPVPEEVVHHTCQSPSVNRYTFTSDPRGVCLIIDCVGNDGEMLARTFKSLHFNVTLHKWLGLVETVSTLRGVFQGNRRQRDDGFVCCIISRGTGTHLLATDTNCEGLRLKDVRRLFNGDRCPVLVGKPKLFFIQSYSVPAVQPCAAENHWDENLETDGGGRLTPDCVPSDADVLWSHCWTGEEQLRQGQHHSVYLKALTDAFGRSQARSRHVLDLHKDVNRAIFEHNRRRPGEEYHIDLKTTLTKDLYL
ncbi:CASP8 and FADD-like apoptosis regulator isoform X2 [Festucalex cinctus]